jgi:integrase
MWICRMHCWLPLNAGIQHLHAHMLRRTFATKIRESEVPIDRFWEFLGHKTMAMVLRYAKVRPKQLQDDHLWHSALFS